jgi:pimeloyl-ACP methyl ester carboxylesterase
MPRLLPSSAPPTTPWRARHAEDGYGLSAEPSWRQIEWPRHLRQIEIDGRTANYVDLGSGEENPVVFVHGLSGQWQNWLENLPRIAEERRVIAVDLPGSGRSEMPREEISIPGYGRFVEAVCERLDLGEIALVGNSMGGFIAAEVAIQFPPRVERLVLVSAAGITSANVYRAPTALVGRIATALTAYTAARQRAMAKRPVSRHVALALIARHPSRLAPDLAWDGLMKGAGKPGFRDSLMASIDYDFRDRLPEIRQPTLIVWGENDSVISVRDAHEYERLIPDSRKVVMRDTGHVPMIERPQAFNDLLIEFLHETGPADAKEPAEGESQPV